MDKISISAQLRDGKGSSVAERLRRSGFVPSIVYGKGDPLMIAVPKTELKVLRSHKFSEGVLIEISLEGKDGAATAAVIKDVQFHPLTNEVVHLDFLRISLEEKIRIKVPIVLSGDARGVKSGGVLEQTLRELEIEALPTDIPEHITVDVSDLDLGHSLHVETIKLGEGIKILTDAGSTVAAVVGHEEEEKETSAEEEAVPAGPEVTKEKKEKDSSGKS